MAALCSRGSTEQLLAGWQAHSVDELHANAAAKQKLHQARQAAQERLKEECSFRPATNATTTAGGTPCTALLLRASTQVGAP